MSDKPKVYVTRRVPSRGIELLKPHCTITQWDDDSVVPRETLIQNIAGMDALFCLLTDKIDAEVLDAGIALYHTKESSGTLKKISVLLT